ncbi:MAG: hypothetical protein ABW091_10575 [Microbacterium sp.]
MKHITYAEKSILVGDDAADALLDYAKVIAIAGTADTVTLRSISPDGNTVDASILLTATTMLIVESTNSVVEPPSNEVAIADIRRRIEAIHHPATVEPETQSPSVAPDDLDFY